MIAKFVYFSTNPFSTLVHALTRSIIDEFDRVRISVEGSLYVGDDAECYQVNVGYDFPIPCFVSSAWMFVQRYVYFI